MVEFPYKSSTEVPKHHSKHIPAASVANASGSLQTPLSELTRRSDFHLFYQDYRAASLPIECWSFTLRDGIWSNESIGGKMRYVFRRHLFLLIGLLTLCLFHLVEGLNRAGKTELAQALAIPMRVLIVPMYVVWLLFTMAVVAMAGPHSLPSAIAPIISSLAGLGAYALLDYVVN